MAHSLAGLPIDLLLELTTYEPLPLCAQNKTLEAAALLIDNYMKR